MKKQFTVTIDGKTCEAYEGETVFEVASRAGIGIPTLCHDSRLEPAGACRVCLVEIEGERRLQPGCAWKVRPDMKLVTESERIAKHQSILYGLYLADHKLDDDGLPIETANTNQLRELAMQRKAAQVAHQAPMSKKEKREAKKAGGR